MAVMPANAKIIGALPSPFVRKVIALCTLKGVPFEVDPVIPFFGNDDFSKLNPLRRVPVFVDDQVTLADSTVICEYLEDRYPEPHAFPRTPAQRAQARWLEEYADSRLADICIWKIFYPTVVKPHVFGATRDPDAVARVVREELPEALAYLESHAPEQGFLFGDISVCEIALAVHLRNLRWARVELQPSLAPKALAWLGRVEAHPSLARVSEIADRVVRTKPAEQRQLIRDMGLAVTTETIGTPTPRRGPMTV